VSCFSYVTCGYVYVFMFGCSLRIGKHICTKNWHAYSSTPGREHRKVRIPDKISRVRLLVRVIPVARKLSTIKEWRKDQSCFQEDRTQGHNPEKLSWAPVPVKIFSVARKLTSIGERRRYQSFLFRRSYKSRNCPVFQSL
jgi:hypothetical protein